MNNYGQHSSHVRTTERARTSLSNFPLICFVTSSFSDFVLQHGASRASCIWEGTIREKVKLTLLFAMPVPNIFRKTKGTHVPQHWNFSQEGKTSILNCKLSTAVLTLTERLRLCVLTVAFLHCLTGKSQILFWVKGVVSKDWNCGAASVGQLYTKFWFYQRSCKSTTVQRF